MLQRVKRIQGMFQQNVLASYLLHKYSVKKKWRSNRTAITPRDFVSWKKQFMNESRNRDKLYDGL